LKRLHPIRPRSHLTGPGTLPLPLAIGRAPVCGGGWVALIDREAGLLGAWSAGGRESGSLRLFQGRAPLVAPWILSVGPGTWCRRAEFPGGGWIEERGLLHDALPGIILEYRMEQGDDPRPIQLQSPDHEPASEYPSHPLSEGATSTFLLADAGEWGRAERLLGPLAAREMQRSSRGSDPLHPPTQLFSDRREEELGRALHLLREAPLSVSLDGRPSLPVLGGVEQGLPTFLQGSGLTEFALASLLLGEREAALLGLGDQDPDFWSESGGAHRSDPLLLLELAASWGEWTGSPGELVDVEAGLAETVRRASRALTHPEGGEGALRTILKRLEGCLEPLGAQSWVAEALLELDSPPPPRSSALILPVIGLTPPAPPEAQPPTREPSEPREPRLPSPESFAPPGSPGLLPWRTVHAARWVRSWIQGRWGVRPEVAFGRVRLAPHIGRGTRMARLEGLRVGSARLTVDCRREGRLLTFTLHQEAGPIPLNLVFEPHLSLTGIREIRMGDERIDPMVTPDRDGIRMKLQFPLDPSRRITLVVDD